MFVGAHAIEYGPEYFIGVIFLGNVNYTVREMQKNVKENETWSECHEVFSINVIYNSKSSIAHIEMNWKEMMEQEKEANTVHRPKTEFFFFLSEFFLPWRRIRRNRRKRRREEAEKTHSTQLFFMLCYSYIYVVSHIICMCML